MAREAEIETILERVKLIDGVDAEIWRDPLIDANYRVSFYPSNSEYREDQEIGYANNWTAMTWINGFVVGRNYKGKKVAR